MGPLKALLGLVCLARLKRVICLPLVVGREGEAYALNLLTNLRGAV
jgi:hypothetical protein